MNEMNNRTKNETAAQRGYFRLKMYFPDTEAYGLAGIVIIHNLVPGSKSGPKLYPTNQLIWPAPVAGFSS